MAEFEREWEVLTDGLRAPEGPPLSRCPCPSLNSPATNDGQERDEHHSEEGLRFSLLRSEPIEQLNVAQVTRRFGVDEQHDRTALLSALTTEHFVLQTANNSTYAEASARSSLYVMALSSSLVAIGFAASSTDALIPFAAILLPTVFLLGVFTVVRLVETSLESMYCLRGIARIRGYYRTLGPEAARQFSPELGRWPDVTSPAERLGSAFAFFGTTASVIAIINNVVAGVGITFLVRLLVPWLPSWAHAAAGVVGALALTWLFYTYQRWRFKDDGAMLARHTES